MSEQGIIRLTADNLGSSSPLADFPIGLSMMVSRGLWFANRRAVLVHTYRGASGRSGMQIVIDPEANPDLDEPALYKRWWGGSSEGWGKWDSL